MSYNRTVRAKKGMTGFVFHTPLYDEQGNVVVLASIDLPHCTVTFTVSDAAGVMKFQGPMVAHPDQVNFPNHLAYAASSGDMAIDAGTYRWEIKLVDAAGKVTKYPIDDGNEFGTFKLLPSLT